MYKYPLGHRQHQSVPMKATSGLCVRVQANVTQSSAVPADMMGWSKQPNTKPSTRKP